MKIMLNIKNKKAAKQKAKNGILMYAAVIMPKQKIKVNTVRGFIV
ncbi:MAG: hypothetical protein WA066_01865 [Candidatus Omnitrophota bacterium]